MLTRFQVIGRLSRSGLTTKQIYQAARLVERDPDRESIVEVRGGIEDGRPWLDVYRVDENTVRRGM